MPTELPAHVRYEDERLGFLFGMYPRDETGALSLSDLKAVVYIIKHIAKGLKISGTTKQVEWATPFYKGTVWESYVHSGNAELLKNLGINMDSMVNASAIESAAISHNLGEYKNAAFILLGLEDLQDEVRPGMQSLHFALTFSLPTPPEAQPQANISSQEPLPQTETEQGSPPLQKHLYDLFDVTVLDEIQFNTVKGEYERFMRGRENDALPLGVMELRNVFNFGEGLTRGIEPTERSSFMEKWINAHVKGTGWEYITIGNTSFIGELFIPDKMTPIDTWHLISAYVFLVRGKFADAVKHFVYINFADEGEATVGDLLDLIREAIQTAVKVEFTEDWANAVYKLEMMYATLLGQPTDFKQLQMSNILYILVGQHVLSNDRLGEALEAVNQHASFDLEEHE